jgi:NADH-quinone oxidoreductase subunit L
VTLITLLLLMAAAGKSAQIPLYVWLPDAMAGPTPVSALIHAATMVTAGIYMITRSSALYALAPFSAGTVAVVGAATAIFAGTMAVAQFDIKRVLAYSTISQLGFMVAAVGLGGYVAGMFHLVTHAFFKALLFLSSGSVIHALEHGHSAERSASSHHAAAQHAVGGGGHGDDHSQAESGPGQAHAPAAHGEHAFDPQDMRNMGGLWNRLPVTKWVYLVGALALAGIVPFSGFWSKDEILLDAWDHQDWLVYGLLTVAAFFTAFYMGRQLMMVFAGRPRTDAARHAAESPPIITIPLIILAVLALFGGVLNLPSIAGWTPPGAHALGNWLEHTLSAAPAEGHVSEAATEGGAEHAEGAEEAHVPALNLVVAGISTVVALVGLGAGASLYRGRPAKVEEPDPLQGVLGPVFTVLKDKWYVDEIYDLLIIQPYNWLARVSADLIDWRFWHDWFHDTLIGGVYNAFARFSAEFLDLGVVDGLISQVPAALARAVAGGFRRFQSGYVRSYALVVFVGVVAVLGYLLFVR